MKVKELIEVLQQLDPDATVFIPDHNEITDAFIVFEQGWQIRLKPDYRMRVRRPGMNYLVKES